MVNVYNKKCRTKGCGKVPSYGASGTKTVDYCAHHSPGGIVEVCSRNCRTGGCGKQPSYGVVGTNTAEYCAQHAPDGMVNVKRRKCRTEGCGKKPLFGVAKTRTAKCCAQHARLKCGVEGYKEGEVDPHNSGKETIDNILPNGPKHQTVHSQTTGPLAEGNQGSHKRVRYPEITSTASMRPISRESIGGAGTMQDIDYAGFFREGGSAALLLARYTIRYPKLYLRNISFTSLLLYSCLGCIPLLIGLPFLRGLLTRMVFLPYAYHVAVSCLCFFSCFFSFIVGLFCVPPWRRCPLLATFLPVSFCLLSLLFSLECVFGLIWFGSVYLVTTAGFVAV